MNLNGRIDRIREEVNRRALLFCCDNMDMLGKLHTVETAMLVGVSVVFEQPISEEDDGQLHITPEGEELLRQLFEGEDKPEDLHINEIAAGVGKTYMDGKVTIG
jgi:hypothetical protein